MDLEKLLWEENEKPLDRIVYDGGYARVFRTIGCIGDSLSSGEHESRDAEGNQGYHDFYDYSWGQYIARNAGIDVYNFSKGGMTAKCFMESFGEKCGAWTDAKKCQAYILALGVNDIYTKQVELGAVSDVDLEDYNNNKPTFAGYYAMIIQKLKAIQPDAKFFLVTLPNGVENLRGEEHAALLKEMAELFSNTYVIDLRTYSPKYDSDFKSKFFVGGHMNAAGYILTAQMITSYIDYIVRHNFKDFAQVGFIGTPYKYI
ncbi:MAG: SGNH/GDSL hydrolase family protein [Ruminococcaceae bacterium]|nr:SGNH/GDSL hydrolase family protein [Oscillospiraceae bacterium]